MNTGDLDSVIDEIKSKWFSDKKNQDIAKESKIPRVDMTFWQNVRISTMGRLSEINAVSWEIEKGYSKYGKPDQSKESKRVLVQNKS